jgi:uncharacterized protein (DUF488 family)
MIFFTIGHSNRTQDALVALLRTARIEVLADVRQWPRSRRNPQFNGDELTAVLRPLGIEYRHVQALGGRRKPDPAADPKANALWREPAFHNYADYANTDAFRAALQHLIETVGSRRCALMCAEAVWWRCHRRIITDHLLARGYDVEHIMTEGHTQPATLTPGAVPQPDGRVLYPTAPELF